MHQNSNFGQPWGLFSLQKKCCFFFNSIYPLLYCNIMLWSIFWLSYYISMEFPTLKLSEPEVWYQNYFPSCFSQIFHLGKTFPSKGKDPHHAPRGFKNGSTETLTPNHIKSIDLKFYWLGSRIPKLKKIKLCRDQGWWLYEEYRNLACNLPRVRQWGNIW